MKIFLKTIVLVFVASGSHEALCPRGPLYNLIEANVARYAKGVIERTLYPNSHVMWKRLKAEHGKAKAKVIMSETYSVFAEILRNTNPYWNVRGPYVCVEGGNVKELYVYPKGYADRFKQGEYWKQQGLRRIARARHFNDDLPGFDYDESAFYPEYGPFPTTC